jgi:hypothetical protein
MSHSCTLPIRVQPIAGEALDSWLAAVAHRLQTPLGDLLREIGLPSQTSDRSGDVLLNEWTVLLREPEIEAIANATGISRSAIAAMTLSRYDGHALIIDLATRQVEQRRLWGRHGSSRFCPDCLAETGGRWQLSWRLGWSFACTIHRRLLPDVCPGCQRVPRRRPPKSF